MATTNTTGMRVQNAINMANTISSNSYVFVGRPTEWVGGDQNPPTPDNSISEYYQTFRQMLSLKLISATDVFHGIVKFQWVSGSTYDMYSHLINTSAPSNSGAVNFYESNAVVINQNNNVYVCLNNNNGAQSTVEPLSLDDDAFTTSDGYQWLRLYNLSASNLSDNSTSTFIPVATNPENDVVETISGAIYTVVVDDIGDNYTTSPAGAPNQIPYYFCNILGDGTGAVARVSITAGSVDSVEVVRNGQDYTYGELDFVSGRVYQSLNDLDAEINGLNPEGNGGFRSTVIISPPGGWGSNLVSQLGATTLMVFVSLDGNQTDFQSDVTYRQIGILSGAENTNNANTLSATKSILLTGGNSTDFIVGERISQSYLDSEFIERTAFGTVISWDSSNSILKYTQSPEDTDTNNILYKFQGNTAVVGAQSTASAIPDVDTSTNIDNVTIVSGYADEEFSLFTGDILYLSNRSPILRNETQTEKITLIIRY